MRASSVALSAWLLARVGLAFAADPLPAQGAPSTAVEPGAAAPAPAAAAPAPAAAAPRAGCRGCRRACQRARSHRDHCRG